MQTATVPTTAPAARSQPSARDAFVADMAAIRGGTPAPAAAPPPATEAPPAAAEDDIPVDPLALADGGDPDADDPEASAAALAAAAKEAETPAEEALDPAQAKRLEAAQREERRRKEAAAADKAQRNAEHAAKLAEIAEREQSVADKARAVKEYEALKERASTDPLAVVDLLRSLGYKDDAFASVAYAAWAETPKGRENPANRAHAERMARDREQGSGLADVRKELAELKAEREAEKRNAEAERAVGGFLDAAAELAESGKMTEDDGEGNEIVTATVEAPIFKRWLKSDRAAARQQVLVVANELATKAQRERDPMPTPAEVLAEVEKRERIALRKRGIDLSTIGAPPAAAPPKKPAPPPPGKTLARAGGAPAPTKKKLTDEEIRADFIRQRASGKFDDD